MINISIVFNHCKHEITYQNKRTGSLKSPHRTNQCFKVLTAMILGAGVERLVPRISRIELKRTPVSVIGKATYSGLM